jgi:hypothetical protein
VLEFASRIAVLDASATTRQIVKGGPDSVWEILTRALQCVGDIQFLLFFISFLTLSKFEKISCQLE